jgi:hypothetical protein
LFGDEEDNDLLTRRKTAGMNILISDQIILSSFSGQMTIDEVQFLGAILNDSVEVLIASFGTVNE